VHQNPAALGQQLSADQLEQRRLAATARAEDRDDLAARHGERQAAEHRQRSIAEVQVADLDDVFAARGHDNGALGGEV